MMNEETLKHAEIIDFGTEMNFIKNQVLILDSVGSTNEFIMQLDDIDSGMVLMAKTQSSGRGRSGKSWHSADGGLWFSIGINPDEVVEEGHTKQGYSQKIKGINIASALAVVKALSNLDIKNVGIKWPNDVYLKDHKICGILSQSRFEVDNNRIVVGFGLNVNQKSSDFPEDLQKTAGSLLSLTGKMHNILEILKRILIEFDSLLIEVMNSGICKLCDEINDYSILNNRIIRLKRGSDVYTGKVAKIDEDGSLLLEVLEENAQLPTRSGASGTRSLVNFYAGEIIEF